MRCYPRPTGSVRGLHALRCSSFSTLLAAFALAIASGCGTTSPSNNTNFSGNPVFTPDTGGGIDAVTDTGPATQDDAAVADAGGNAGDDAVAPPKDAGGPNCQSSCEPEGSKKCSGLGFQVCEDLEDNGCFSWSKVNTCGKGEVCSDGDCVKKCPDEPCTTAGAKKCSAKGEIIECFDFDSDGCLEWGNASPCPLSQVCSGGFCALGCKDECTTVGAKKCDGSNVVECSDSDSNGCLDWGKSTDCGKQVCSAGFCADTCKSECTTEGAKKCDGNGVSECSDFNNDKCLEWGTPVTCGKDQVCSGGVCADTCKSECTAIGAKKCDEAGKVTACGDYNKDGCLEWGTGAACDAGLVCDGGFCANKCSNQCTVSGAKKCDEAGKITVCGDYNKDGCLEWGSSTPCAEGSVCSSGVCAQKCSDSCNVKNAKQCVAGQKAKYEICDDYNKDGCLEWGTAQTCGAGQACSLGQCAATCQNACDSQGGTQCKGNATQVCDDYNADGCLEWGTPKGCEAYELCVEGACKQKPADAKVVINEVMYDAAGPDTDTFVELRGPAGTKLTGWVLVGVNGAGGANYNALELTGVIPADGFFVIAHSDAKDWIAKHADIKSKKVDYQNGPDSVELRFGAKTIDSVGYGKFGAADKFAGEGTAAPDTAGGQSIGRDDKQTDTDNNSKDFKLFDAPTPGSSNSAGNKAPTANLQCPQTGNPGQKLDFDASGSTDPDGTIKSYVFEWGDATTSTTGTSSKVQHLFAKTGSYTVKVTIADDQGLTDSASCNVSISAANKPPVAKLTCPGQVGVNKAASLDGSASSDPDGSISVYTFDFGDGGNPASGAAAKVTKTWTKAGAYKVTLTVTDNKGGKHSATCSVNVSDATPPQVTMIKPGADKQVTQGDKLPIIVDASPPTGKKITEVWVEANGTLVSKDTTAPYNFDYTVPANAKTGSIIALVAKAKDSTGTVGESKAIKLSVANDKPAAKFTAVVSGKLKVVMDASASSDTETAKADLEVRWDFTGDGTWDTPWSKTKIYEHTYAKDGKYTIKVLVRDAVGQTTEAVRTVTLSSIQYVSGDITTTTWTGTIVVTGDVKVAGGQVLTVGKGTQVLFTNIDQNNDKVGDFDLTISGKMIVNGTKEDPVVFTVYGKDKSKNGWNRLKLQGQGSTINWAIIEYAQVGVEVLDASTLTDTVVRFNGEGIVARNSGKPKLVNMTVKDNDKDGVWINESAVVSVTGGEYSSNGKSGIASYSQSSGAALYVTGATLESNKQNGLFVRGRLAGLVTKSNIQNNAYEGVRASAYAYLDPTIAVRLNNISENATVGARVSKVLNLSVKSSSTKSGSTSSALWKVPGGFPLDMVRYQYTENDYYNKSYSYATGSVYGGGKTLVTTKVAASSQWREVSAFNAKDVQARVADTSASYWGQMTVLAVAWIETKAVREVSVITNGGKLDFRHNYFGTFPNVRTVVDSYPADAANLHGFVGKAFSSTWDRHPYYGGETLTQDVAWAGEVWVTGDITVPTGRTLSAAAGTKVNMVRYDALGDGTGDIKINVAGTLKTSGSAANPVVFSENGAVKKPGAYYEVRVHGGSAKALLNGTVFEYGRTGLFVGAGAHVIGDLIVRNNALNGLQLSGATNAKLKKVTAKDNGSSGVEASVTKGTSFDGLTAEGNKRNGVRITHSTSVVSITNATIQKNTDDGIYVEDGTAYITLSNIKSNGAGVRYHGSGKGNLSKSNILYNQNEGIVLMSLSARQPSPTITGNNIFGNSVSAGGVIGNANLTAQSSHTGSGTKTSPHWATPLAEAIESMRVSYSENDYYNKSYSYAAGYAYMSAPKSASIWSTKVAYSARWLDIAGHKATKLYAQTTDTSSSYYGITKITQVFYRSPKVLKELAAVTGSGKVNCKDNYWGVFPDVANRLTLSRTDAVDYQGFVGGEKNGTGPQ